MRRLGFIGFTFMFMALLVSCGSGEAPSVNSGMGLAPKMIKLAESGSGILTASAEVFDSTGKSLGQKDLSIDLEQGRAYSPDGEGFKLEKGFSYSGLIIFNYQAQGVQLPIGFVIKTQEVTEDFTNFNWSAEEIVLSNPNAQGAADLASTFVPEASIPNLDTNGNGLSNLQEFIEGLDPSDLNSAPQPPAVVGTVAPDGYVDSIDIELDFTDPSGVALIEPEGPRCGYSIWEVTPVDATTKHLKASFNVHSLPTLIGQGELTLKIKATDFLAANKVYEYRVKYTKTDTNDPAKLGPEIGIFKPIVGSIVSGDIPGEAEACDSKGIKTLEIVNSGADLGDQEGSEALYEGLIKTEALGDGENRTLEFRAVTTDGKIKTKSVTVTVANDSPIKIDHPTPGSAVRDQFELAAYVNNQQMPNVALFSVESVTSSPVLGVLPEDQEEDPSFAVLKKTSPGNAYVQPIDVSFVEHELDFTVHFKAVASDGKFATRTVGFRVDNDPNISIGMRNASGDFNAVLSPGIAFIDWEVTNRGPDDKVILNDKNQQDANLKWLGSGSIPLVLQGNNEDNKVPTKYKIWASRVAPNNNAYFTEKEISVTQIKIKGLESGFIDPFTNPIKLEGASSTTNWKVVFESKNKTAELTGIGNKIFLDTLEPRTSYEMVVQILNASGKGVITESLPIKFTTTDFRLVSWSPFYWGQIKYGSYQYNPILKAFITNNGTEWVDQPIVGPHFLGDGVNYANTNTYKTIHGSSQELSVELLLSINDPNRTVDYLVSKTGEYILGFDPVNGYKINLQLNKLCEDAPGDFIASGVPVTEGLHHLVVTYNAVAKQVVFYVDGQKKIVPVEGLKLQNLCDTVLTLNSRLDLNDQNTVDDFDGVLGDLAIYNRALGESEVLASCKRLGVCF